MYLKQRNYKNFVSNWLLISISLIFLMIIVGGLTRLTNSGLSITEWELFKGIFPPINSEGWTQYFELYKNIPQYKQVNFDMTLNDFKIIFYWEYFHRLLGRLIGIFYLIPLIYLTLKKVLTFESLVILYFVFALICFQGFLGWYMVESGLVYDVTVSHFRLSIHLVGAFIIISILFWNFLNIKNFENKAFFNKENISLKILLSLIIIQIIFGAFVSGLDAGMIYQTWPKMNTSFIPDDIILKEINLDYLNNQSFVQFIHRSTAYLITVFVIVTGFIYLYKKKIKLLKNYFFVLIVLITQIILGIITLISGLNLLIASLHQITSVILVFTILNLNHKFS